MAGLRKDKDEDKKRKRNKNFEDDDDFDGFDDDDDNEEGSDFKKDLNKKYNGSNDDDDDDEDDDNDDDDDDEDDDEDAKPKKSKMFTVVLIVIIIFFVVFLIYTFCFKSKKPVGPNNPVPKTSTSQKKFSVVSQSSNVSSSTNINTDTAQKSSGSADMSNAKVGSVFKKGEVQPGDTNYVSPGNAPIQGQKAQDTLQPSQQEQFNQNQIQYQMLGNKPYTGSALVSLNGKTIPINYKVTNTTYAVDAVNYTKEWTVRGNGVAEFWLNATYHGRPYTIQVTPGLYEQLSQTGITPVGMVIQHVQGGGVVIGYMQAFSSQEEATAAMKALANQYNQYNQQN